MHGIRDHILARVAPRVRRPSKAHDGHTMLLFQPDHLGDIILSEPAVRLLRETSPESKLVAIVGPWSEQIARFAWPVDEIVTVDFPGFTRKDVTAHPIDPYVQIGREAERLRHHNGSDAVVLRDDAWWAAWLARSVTSQTVITSEHSPTCAFGDRSVDLTSASHATDRALLLAAEAAPGEVNVSKFRTHPILVNPEPGASTNLRRDYGIGEQYVIIHPCAGARVKHWSMSGWSHVISAFKETMFVITGTEVERAYCEAIARRCSNALSVAGETTLPELIDIIDHAHLVCGTDNGPLHLAAALGKPTVSLFGPSDPMRFAPRGASVHLVIEAGWTCPRCGDLSAGREEGCGCMIAIQPETAIERISGLFGSTDAV